MWPFRHSRAWIIRRSAQPHIRASVRVIDSIIQSGYPDGRTRPKSSASVEIHEGKELHRRHKGPVVGFAVAPKNFPVQTARASAGNRNTR